MKRQGFVANSSSSSFLTITTKENHEKALSKLHPYIIAVVEKICSHDKFLGQDVVYVGDLCPMDYSHTFDDFDLEWEGEIPKDKWDDEMVPYEAYNKYETKIKELGEVFEWSM